MIKAVMKWFLVLGLAVLLIGAPLSAKNRGGRPGGWDKGEKRGWHSDVPPGQENKWDEKSSHKEKKERTRERIEKREHQGDDEGKRLREENERREQNETEKKER